jgi:hypothetical protein
VNLLVRPASLDDIDWLLVQLQAFSVFQDTKRELFPTEAFAREALAGMIQNHLMLVADHPAVGPVGFISGYVLPHPYNPSIQMLSETFWWVAEEHRGTRAGLLLLEAFLAWGREHADWITFALEAKSPVSDDVLLKRGFKIQERSFLLEV